MSRRLALAPRNATCTCSEGPGSHQQVRWFPRCYSQGPCVPGAHHTPHTQDLPSPPPSFPKATLDPAALMSLVGHLPTPPPPSLSQNLGHGLATQDSALSQGCLLRHHQPWYHLPNPLPCPWPFCHWTWACSSVIGAVPAMEGWVGMEQGTWGKQGRAGRWWLVTLLSRLCGVLGKPWPWLLPPSRSSSILPSWDCSVGSTKVNTMPGLLARAVLQGETAPLKLLSCILGEPTLLVPSPPRPAPYLPAR